MTDQPTPSHRAIVSHVTGGRDSGSAIGTYHSDAKVKAALQRALLENGLLGDANADYRITVKILDIDLHRAGWNRVEARYTIHYSVSEVDGTAIIDETVTTSDLVRSVSGDSLSALGSMMAYPLAILQKNGPLEALLAAQPGTRGIEQALNHNIEDFIAVFISMLNERS